MVNIFHHTPVNTNTYKIFDEVIFDCLMESHQKCQNFSQQSFILYDNANISICIKNCLQMYQSAHICTYKQ